MQPGSQRTPLLFSLCLIPPEKTEERKKRERTCQIYLYACEHTQMHTSTHMHTCPLHMYPCRHTHLCLHTYTHRCSHAHTHRHRLACIHKTMYKVFHSFAHLTLRTFIITKRRFNDCLNNKQFLEGRKGGPNVHHAQSLVGAAIYAILCSAQSITTKCFHFTVRN